MRFKGYSGVIISFCYVLVLTVLFIGAKKENAALRVTRKISMEMVIDLSSQLNSCNDMLKVYEEVDLYAYPH